MSVTVYIPTSFRRATNNRDRVQVAANDVSRLLDQLEASYGGLKGLVRDEGGEVHHHVSSPRPSRTATRSRSSRHSRAARGRS